MGAGRGAAVAEKDGGAVAGGTAGADGATGRAAAGVTAAAEVDGGTRRRGEPADWEPEALTPEAEPSWASQTSECPKVQPSVDSEQNNTTSFSSAAWW